MQWLVRNAVSVNHYELTLVGWLGSYGGEDSTSDISRGEIHSGCDPLGLLTYCRSLGRNSGHAAPSEALQEVQHQSNLVHTWYSSSLSASPARCSQPQGIPSKHSQKTAPPSEMPATRLVFMVTRTRILLTCHSSNNVTFSTRPTKC
jgi:hypothetical protein